MTDCYLIRTEMGFLPADDSSRDALKRWKVGDAAKVEMTKARNYQFFRKWWALINFAFDHWEPEEKVQFKGVPVEKNLDRFRKDITILAGHFTASYRVDGSCRIEPKSIAFGNMSEDTFADLYSKTIDVVLKHILTNYEKEELEGIVDQVMAFA